ncbi:hypothetical protein [Streptomyces rhizosphaerihabitans]|uniref:hypothetical protein n=1 Tax=Streptomyces rhizosphaerihabitans TaxID=1266770 RepID=UPI0021BE47F2|nr:hypothetical protein [Streptomyces rhizosphaerihabitans]MCT9010621.1 hypothetical protein [Streptomyces rhizosphaerihabitans]
MSKRQIRQMFRLMAGGQAVQLTSPMASVKKLARLAFIAQQFGYEYADVRQGSGRNNALTMLIVPDPGPQAQARAAQNWAQYPKAGDGVSLPPVVPDALELLKARINFDLTGKNAEKRMVYAAVGLTVGCAALGVRAGGGSGAFTVAGILWAVLMVVLGIGLVVTRKRNAKFAALLRAAGFAPVTEEGGRVRYLPPTAGYGGQSAGPYGPYAPYAGQAAPYAAQMPAPYSGQVPQAQAQPPYAVQAPQAPYAGQVPQAQVPYSGQAPAPYPGQAPQAQYAGQPPYAGPVQAPAQGHAQPRPHASGQTPAQPQPQPPGPYGSPVPGPYSQWPPATADPGGPGNPYADQPGPVPQPPCPDPNTSGPQTPQQ